MQAQLKLRTCSMNSVVTGPAYPQGAGDQIFFAEQLLESFFAVQVPGDQVMAGELGDRAFAEFTALGLGWEF